MLNVNTQLFKRNANKVNLRALFSRKKSKCVDLAGICRVLRHQDQVEHRSVADVQLLTVGQLLEKAGQDHRPIFWRTSNEIWFVY